MTTKMNNESLNTQTPQVFNETKIGTTLKDLVNILTGLTGMASTPVYWSPEDGKFFTNNNGTWTEFRQFKPMKLHPELLIKLKKYTTSIPGGSLFYITPENVRTVYTELLS